MSLTHGGSSEAPLGVLVARLWREFNGRRKRQFGFLLALILASAFSEVIALGAVLPFIAALTSPQAVFRNHLVALLATRVGITSPDQLLLPLTLAFIAAAIGAGLIRMLLLWVSTRLAFASGADLSIAAYRRTLYQPYQVHVSRNSSEVISGLTLKVHGVVFGFLLPLLMLIGSLVIVFSITAALVAVDPLVACISALGFGAAYFFITLRARRRLERNGRKIAVENTRVIRALQEGLGGIRDVLLDGTQAVYCDVYLQADRPLRRAQGENIYIAGSPRFSMEALGMVMIAAIAYSLSRKVDGVSTALPILGTLALGAQRLLPALQQVYISWASIIAHKATLSDTLGLLDQPVPDDVATPPPRSIQFTNKVRFESVSFRYEPDGPWVLDDFNLTISKGTRVGIVGSTGGGKSTLLDLLMGLLPPTKGRILVDEEEIIGGRLRAWQRSIAHVPQSIFLSDSSIAANIAFGVPPNEIAMDRVRLAAYQAQIVDFIEAQPEGFLTPVGERGVRLSGGQRQRLGIARALYKQASVLVFDEATSALDNSTEQSVMEAIDGLARDLTILMIAHRLSTVRRCDLIIEIEAGRVAGTGTYDQLLRESQTFRKMVEIAH